MSRDGDLGHLEGDVTAMEPSLRADLDEFLFEGCQRPVLDWLWRRQRAQKIAEIIGERMQLETDGVGGE